MLYVIQHGGNFVQRATPAKDIVYLVCSLDRILESHNDYYFSDGHATDNYTAFYDNQQINNLINLIDWAAIRSTYWGGQENLNIKRKKQAEFLVAGDLQPSLIVGFGCFNDAAKKKLILMGIQEEKTKIIPNAYY